MRLRKCVFCDTLQMCNYYGACFACYAVPANREELQEEANDGNEHANKPSSLAMPDTKPTHAVPGSREKVAVLTDRYARGVSLFHDYDSRGAGDTLPDTFKGNPSLFD